MVSLIIRLMLVVSLLLSIYIMSVTLKRCRSEKRYGFLYCCVAIFLYTLGYFIEITCGTLGGSIIGVKIMYAGASFMAPLFFFFSADYCEVRPPKIFSQIPMMIIPVLFYLVVLTFDHHSLLYSDFYYDAEKMIPGIVVKPGPLYLVGAFYPLFCTAIACAVLIHQIIKQKQKQRFGLILLVFSALAPLIGNFSYIILSFFVKSALGQVNFTAFLMVLSNFLFFYNIVRNDMFDLAPKALTITLDLIRDIFIVLDQNMAYVGSNNKAMELFPSLSEHYKGKSILQMETWPQELRFEENKSFEIDSDDTLREIEFTLPHRPGRNYSGWINRVVSKSGTALGWVILIQDITETVKMTALLKEQTKIAVQANRAKSEFLATMSHEIRTPLNAIIGFSQVELQGDLQGSSRNNITLIYQSGAHLLGIIDDILDLSKIEAGSFELIPVEYETPSLISHTVDLSLVRIGSKPVKFMLEIGADFPLKLKGDELRVKQILNNLLSNAAKYTREGTITLTVSSEPLAGSSDKLAIRFTVRDTGIGIRSEDMQKLFAKYSQLDTGTNRKTEGTGLGLSITKQLAEMMSGSIAVESEYGKGSVFTVEIIQGLVDSADFQSGTIGEETAENLRNFRYTSALAIDGLASGRINRSPLPAGNVLVVDDLLANLLVARELLTPYGLHIDAASSGKEAIEKVQQNNYDLILMDHMMPEMDGVETLSHLRRLGGFNTPVIALTANALRGMKEYYLEQGFHDYLSKPINPQALDETLVKWIQTGTGEQRAKSESMAGYQQRPYSPLPLVWGLDAQRLDMLNHFRAAFDNGREIDEKYFSKFTALIESFGDLHSLSNHDLHSLLVEAGRQRDAQKIRETLPAFYEALQSKAVLDAAMHNNETSSSEIANGILQRIRDALREEDTKKAGKIIKELGAVKLDPERREWYFTLYDLLMEDNIQEALERIEEWLKY